MRADLNRSNFNIKGVVGIVNNQIHTGETYHFMQLVSCSLIFPHLGMNVLISLPFPGLFEVGFCPRTFRFW